MYPEKNLPITSPEVAESLPKDIESDLSLQIFKSNDGGAIAYDVDKNRYFISKNGFDFYRVKEEGFSGYEDQHDVMFFNPHDNTETVFTRDKNLLKMNGQDYFKVDSVDNLTKFEFPDDRKTEYEFVLKSGEKLLVTSNKWSRGYEDWKLFVGDKELPVEQVRRMTDGGTTVINTSEGILFVPSFSRKWAGETVRWKGVELLELSDQCESKLDTVTQKKLESENFTPVQTSSKTTKFTDSFGSLSLDQPITLPRPKKT